MSDKNLWAGELWAIERKAFEAMAKADIKALAGDGGPGASASYELQDNGVAVLEVTGPLASRPSLMARFFSRLLGLEMGHTYQTLLASVGRAERDSRVRSLRFVFDSPGGQVTGLVPVVRAIEGCQKPTEAHVHGMCASAAYWLAAACDRISAEPTAVVGGLGVYAAVQLQKDTGDVLHIVSSQTKHKREDPASEAGQASLQERVDDLCSVFLDDVARLRGTTRAKVDADYGEGKAFVAARAMARGLVDSVITAKEDSMTTKKGVFATLRTQLEETFAKVGEGDDKAQGFLGGLKDAFGKVFAKGEEVEAAKDQAEAEVERLKASAQTVAIVGDQAQDADPKVLAELQSLRAELGKEKQARLDEQKTHALQGLVTTGRLTPGHRDLAAMAWDAEQKDPSCKLFTRLFAEREPNSAVPLAEVGQSGAPLEMTRQAIADHCNAIAAKEGITFEEALDRYEAEQKNTEASA